MPYRIYCLLGYLLLKLRQVARVQQKVAIWVVDIILPVHLFTNTWFPCCQLGRTSAGGAQRESRSRWGNVLTSAIQMVVYEDHQDLQDWVAALICILCVKLPISNLGSDSSYSNLFHLGQDSITTLARISAYS